MTPASLLRVSALALCCAAGAVSAATIPPPPATPAGDTVDVIQGVKVSDPYRWLENPSDPKVQAWSDAQNARTRAYLDALPDAEKIKAKLTTLITATSPAYYQLQARGNVVFAMYSDPAKQQPMLVTLDARANPDSRKMVFDPNAVDAKGLTAVDWFVPSPDGKLVAMSLSKNGSEDGTLHVYEVATGKEVGEPISRVQYPTAGGSLAWTADGKGFWYTRYPGPDAPAADQHFNMQVYFHSLGAAGAGDPLVLGSKDGLERVSEVYLDNRYDRQAILASVQRGDGGEWAFYVLREGQAPVEVANYPDKIVYAAMGPDDAIYGISRAGAPNGKIVKLKGSYASGALANASVIVPESGVAILSGGAEQHVIDLTLSSNRLFVRDIVGGPNQVRIFDLDGHEQGKLPLPEIAANSEIEPLADGDVLFDVSTYLRPRYYADWNPATGKTSETALKVTSPISFADAEVKREFAVSKDGTKIPLNIIMRKGTRLDGSNPTLLYGYGGYGVSMTPGFIGAMRRLWLDHGGIYVVANIRGGAEYGESWHQAGMLTKKQNVFDDFAAAGDYLIAQHYTSHDHLALMGGSNGGLLMGAEITQHPELARAVVSAVGIYDMIRVELDPNGSFNTTEFGTVKNPDQFRALYAYSPYHHAVKGTAYPAVLMLTGATDGRVNPLNSRKFAAALQAATSSDHPILLRTNKNSGHGIGSSLSERIAEQTDQLSFLFDQLGMTKAAKKKVAMH
ncbi:MAG TPA: prolyl oligopeptidase family serine peptidase [Rhizomicrobium sp.]|jgi:prolyl oligopeptidase|nr:prolyl oligopeptidase family serine peptidase [Rhizomicrobium sp.]